ncbi:MAG: endonuclease III [Christensenellales bacterium]
MSAADPGRGNTKQILSALASLYPLVTSQLDFSNPYQLLVATMLSAQCTDKQVNKVTPQVFGAFPDVRAMAAATAETLYPYVKSCGFASKAGNIVAACRLIVSDFEGEVPRTMDGLLTLPGVGRKTASVVLANAFAVPAMPVDTHVFRVSRRLGLASGNTAEKVEGELMQVVPREDWNRAHHWLIYHGRQVCKAQRPLCEGCALQALCVFYGREMSGASKS